MHEAARLLRLARCNLDYLAADPRLNSITTRSGDSLADHAIKCMRDLLNALLLVERIGQPPRPPHPLRRASDAEASVVVADCVPLVEHRELASCDAGATSIEYALIASLVAVVSIVALGAIGDTLNLTFTEVLRGVRTLN